jgi:predicted ATPase/transcriptional regulator with XRE-family HTH domain
MDEPLSFGAWVKRRRKSLDLTQNELANKVGCSLSTIVKIEAEERRPSRQIARLLAITLEIPPDQEAGFLKVARGERRSDRLPPLPGAQSSSSQPAPIRAPSNIPAPSNPLIGREAESQEIVRLLMDPTCRLLTLTGPGGIGKTRLAYEVGLELARRLDNPFEDGIFCVPLASVHNASYLVPAIAQALGVVIAGSSGLRGHLASSLQEKRILLLLDNLEHLLESVDVLAELLQGAPGVKLLVTSQVRLNLSGEWVFDIQGLPFPAPEEDKHLDSYGSVRLFLNYARQARVNYEPGCDEYQAIGQICRLLEGMPLAIQLAAAWARVLTPAEILAELKKTTQPGEFPNFLAAQSRDLPERHRSLQAAFEYSWRLLDMHERRTLSRLSVFEGGFQREAAEQVAGLSLSELAGLMDKSLVLRAEHGRYSLHDLVHKYGFVKLKDDAGEMQATQDKHCAYYGRLLQPYIYRLKGRTQVELQALIESEIDNFRQAWDWALNNKRTREIQFLSQGFNWFYELRGWYHEGLSVFKQAIASLSSLESTPERLDSAERSSLASVLTGYGWFLNRHGNNSVAKEYYLRSLALLKNGENPESLANVLRFLGMLDLQIGAYAEGRTYLDESLRISRSAQYVYGLALCYSHLGMIDTTEGKQDDALQHFESALLLWEELQEPVGTSYCLRHLREVILKIDPFSKQYNEAEQRIQETLASTRASSDSWGTGTTLNHLGVLAMLRDDFASATEHFKEASFYFQKIGDPISLSQSFVYLGRALACQGLDTEARIAYGNGFASAREAESLRLEFDALLGLARLRQATIAPEVLLDLTSQAIENPATSFETRQVALQVHKWLLEKHEAGAQSNGWAEKTHQSLDHIAQSLA